MALLNEINVKGVPHPIVTDDGYYEEMTVGDAEQLISSMYVENSEPYGYRTTGGSADVGNRAYLDKIVGGTVAWNQLFKTFNSTNWRVESGVTVSEWGDNSVTYTASTVNNGIRSTLNPTLSVGHKYLIRALVKANGACKVTFGYQSDSAVYEYVNFTSATTSYAEYSGIKTCASSDSTTAYIYTNTVGIEVSIKNLVLIDLTQMFGTAIADYIYSIEQSQAGAGVAWFKKLFPKDYYEYNAGELLSVEGLKSHDTVGFNQWDEEWEVGSISGGSPVDFSSAIRSKNFCDCLPSTTYYGKCGDYTNGYYMAIWWYDENKQYISYSWACGAVVTSPSNARYFKLSTNVSTYVYGGTYNHDICINLSDPSRNGEYEPYKKYSYQLDSSLTLRGIPKLDASNNLYYDGDEYTSDGTVIRKYGVVDLGTFNWDIFTYGVSTVFRSYDYTGKKPSGSTFVANIICSDYESVSANDLYSLNKDKAIAVHNGNVGLMVNDSTYTDATAFKNAMSGVMLVYELATPTTETAEPFHNIQVVDDFGTEEFVSTGIVPVGHNTRYPANLRDKLQHLPDLAGTDGTYLIKQTGKQMSLVHMPAVFPETPTEDGTYVLKATVGGGTPTYVWEGVNAESGGE